MIEYGTFKDFFITDLKVKRIMYYMKPVSEDIALNSDALTKYSDKTYNDLLDIIARLELIIKKLNISAFTDRFENLKQNWLTKYIDCGMNYDKLNNFYKSCVSGMNETLIDNVKKECIGYSWRFPSNSLKQAITINEFLHVIHSYIINNNDFYQSLNMVDKKTLINDEEVRLYGEITPLADSIFKDIPFDLDCGITDIISFGELNKVIMMVRDRGHALTIEIDSNDKESTISYFIPKICNASMVNKLPGVRKVDENSSALDNTIGTFVVNNDLLSMELFKFISMVPTDFDIKSKYI